MYILVTGGAGFIGSNFLLYLFEQEENIKVINLDLLTYASNSSNLSSLKENPNYIFIHGDISDTSLVGEIFNKYKIKAVINFAAESHVDNSIKNPDIFIKTNIYGTWNLLNTAYKTWFVEPFVKKTEFKETLFYQISTDEVYGSLGKIGKFAEDSIYAPNSPYSASKASCDMLVRSYHHTYGLNAVISNCSNNYGPFQHDEKLIPTIIRNALSGNKIPIYGNGENIRDWLYVKDHCIAIKQIYNHALSKIKIENSYFDTFNIGGNEEWQNIDIANKICQYLDKILPKSSTYKDQISFVKDRAGHDKRYAIDSTKLQNIIGWKPNEKFESGLEKTINWYIKKYKG
ncbi:dTDP-glucose 4,6-dehydratase [Campylobacter sp. RM10532]|uniref:dTDP-glucose 4,6-dehydratase n=1 Tax=Campylobacter molothri TaxID=1032242 RepID=UPI00301D878A|nr:dTDP-glucose 4,6-dehydratase [Campylobacter sp. RM10538]MBZ7945630.1 dTDP-glucose 4,6-dehydratase [Campylobacter sp. RM10532]